MIYRVKNSHGDELTGEVEVNDEGTRITKATGSFAHLKGDVATKLTTFLKAFVDFDKHTPKQKRIIKHCLGRKSLWEKGLVYEGPTYGNDAPQLKKPRSY